MQPVPCNLPPTTGLRPAHDLPQWSPPLPVPDLLLCRAFAAPAYATRRGAPPRATTTDSCNQYFVMLVFCVEFFPIYISAGYNNSIQAIESISSSSSPSLETGAATVGPPNRGAAVATVLSKPKRLQCRFCPAKFAERSQINRHEQFHGVQLKHK